MIKLLIVDDEILVRERLKACLDWEELGYAIMGEASDGEEALAIVERIRPDIAIVDIHMPFISGLEFSEIVKTKYPDTKVVILTGYSDFEYARTAMRAGVAHYLLKPINKDELQSAMLQLTSLIENERARKTNLALMEMNYKESRNVLKEKFMQTLLEPAARSGEFQQELRKYAPGMANVESAVVLVVQIDTVPDRKVEQAENRLWYFAVSNIFSESLSHSFAVENAYDSSQHAVLIVDIGREGSLEQLEKRSEEAKAFIESRLRFTVTVGIGNIGKGIDGISASYREAVTARRNRVVLGRNRIIPYSALEEQVGASAFSADNRQDLLIPMRSGNLPYAIGEIERVFQEIRDRGLLVDQAILVLTDLFLVFAQFAKENEIEVPELASLDFSVGTLLDGHESIEETKAWFVGLCRHVLGVYGRIKLNGYARTVEKVKRYIDDNYANKEIGLETIAANLAINPSHLSSVFKKEAGITISEYLIRKRMAQAKAMMDEGRGKLSEIADSVGFGDPYYFSKSFKKMFGISPSLYAKAKS
ncbi:response regulator [Cohnella terricola]|uniref:Response regulator n=1 Tax=Cohnella terricola TaxID=1289167 RepID=A0A559JN14_9BACL|nr:response regulator [Cohnella terricola]TVY01275.1 response regulator [Cohnella terricola]